MLLANEIGLITGAGRGIGAAAARAFAKAGAAVVLTDVQESSLEAVASTIRSEGGRVWLFALDVSNPSDCSAVAAKVSAEVGNISILVNNAGVGGEAPIEEDRVVDLWERQVAVNLSGPFYVIRAFLPALRATGGSIINLASVASYVAVSSGFGYMATKGGVKMLTQSMAKELAVHGIRVNAVAPGVINTEMTAKRRLDDSWMGPVMGRIPLRRTGEPEEVAEPIVFLASSMARYITGVTLPVDGGFLAV